MKTPSVSKTLKALLGLSLCFTGLAQAASIILVSTRPADDAALISHLESRGHTVSVGSYASIHTELSTFDQLNAADLVIVTRSTDSINYAGNAAEIAAWDSLTVPVLNGNAFLAASNRWGWGTTGATTANASNVSYVGDISAPPLTTTVHPFFTGLTPNTSGDPAISGLSKYSFVTGNGASLLSGASPATTGTGTTIGVRNNASNQNLILASWEAGGNFGEGRTTLGGDRYFYAMPSNFNDLNDNGRLILDNIIAYAVPEPSVAIMGLGALAGFCVRRRRD